MYKTDLFSPADINRAGLCIGCGSCVAQAGSPAVEMNFDVYGELKPHAPKEWLNERSESFSRTCPFSNAALNEDQLAAELFPAAPSHNLSIGHFQTAYVGYAAEDDFRMQGSSGGMVTWVATELLRQGLIDGVAHVIATKDPVSEGRYFTYRISRTEAEVREGAKSRYYPIELSQVLRDIRDTPGRYAVVGIPCFIKAVQLLRREDPVYRERIRYTLGLFCGHMKSARLVESFAWQMKVPVHDIRQVEFRHKDPDRPAYWYNAMLTLHDGSRVNKDWRYMADGDFGAGFFMNSACNFCDDVVAETADISFGDAWGKPYALDGRGTNVLVVRSQVIEQLLSAARHEGRLALDSVNDEFVERTQASGLRQRREGLAYRLTWAPKHIRPLKRVAPDAHNQTAFRKLVYRERYLLSLWSHRFFKLARELQLPKIYLAWARVSAGVYHGIYRQHQRMRLLIKRLLG